jgi:hypothetical protein
VPLRRELQAPCGLMCELCAITREGTHFDGITKLLKHTAREVAEHRG